MLPTKAMLGYSLLSAGPDLVAEGRREGMRVPFFEACVSVQRSLGPMSRIRRRGLGDGVDWWLASWG
jgi:hypothetical protein